MRKILYIFMISLTGCLAACQEEDVKPSGAENTFAPSPEATDATSQLRRDFYEATGCFLLFSDTLRHEYAGETANGVPYYDTELLDMGWNLGGVSSPNLGFEYIIDLSEQEEAVDFLVNYLYPYIETIMPYSLLALKNLKEYSTDYYTGEITDSTSIITYSNDRCIALNIGQLWETDDPDSYAQDVCCEIMLGGWGGDPTYYYDGGEAEAFFVVNKWDYEESKDYFYIENGLNQDEEYMRLMYEVGFLVNTHEETMPTPKEDAASYIKTYLTIGDEVFRTQYGEYDVIMEKYEIIKPLIDATGIKFN